MIKQIRTAYFANFKNAQYCALSTDPIPDDLKNGDEVYMIDTGKNYFWDAISSDLYEDKSSGASDAGQISYDTTQTYPSGSVGAELSDQKNAISQKAPLIINTASGDIARFADGMDGMQIRKIVGTIVPQQAAGTPSPENPLPISGWTGLNIYSEETYDASATPKLTINWQSSAGTIYGGTVTLNEDGSADVVVNRGVANLGDFTYTKNALSGTEHYYFTSNNNSLVNAVGSANYASSGAICEQYVDTGLLATADNGFSIYLLNQRVNIRDFAKDNYTVAEFKTAMAGIKLVYLLATPQTYHFDNIGKLYTYLGTNNIWIDTGAITECDYPADTKLYIDGLTAPDEDMIANANIASGKYFVVNNQLYLSTAAIAAGASIVPGTNCTATNFAEALNALNT